jgi:sulfur-carrier protein
MRRIRIELPHHLRTLAGVDSTVEVEVGDPPTPDAVLDALEGRYPMLRGTIRDHSTRERRAYLRYFAEGRDISHDPSDRPLPTSVAEGREAFIVMGAISGG